MNIQTGLAEGRIHPTGIGLHLIGLHHTRNFYASRGALPYGIRQWSRSKRISQKINAGSSVIHQIEQGGLNMILRREINVKRCAVNRQRRIRGGRGYIRAEFMICKHFVEFSLVNLRRFCGADMHKVIIILIGSRFSEVHRASPDFCMINHHKLVMHQPWKPITHDGDTCRHQGLRNISSHVIAFHHKTHF